MEYKYLLEEKANKSIGFNDVVNDTGSAVINILCYHIDTNCKYPFLQFMLEKMPLVNNTLCLPFAIVHKEDDISETVLQKVRSGLHQLGCDCTALDNDAYKGIIFSGEDCVPYALVNVSSADIAGLNFMYERMFCFVLTSEIINTKRVFNMRVDSDITHLFSDIVSIGCLINKSTNSYFMLPDAVYTCDSLKTSQFQAIFNLSARQAYPSCGKYYYLHRSFTSAINDRINRDRINRDRINRDRINMDNDEPYVNRFALFVEGKMYFESSNQFELTNESIDTLYPEPCVIICYLGNNDNPDMLVKNYNSFEQLSYHKYIPSSQRVVV